MALVVLDTTIVVRYTTLMIKSFRDKETRKLFEGQKSKALPQNLRRNALKKLSQLHFAEDINDLRVPPGNRLEKLSGDREGQHSIRVNEQYRVCFVWEDGAHDVEIVDYH